MQDCALIDSYESLAYDRWSPQENIEIMTDSKSRPKAWDTTEHGLAAVMIHFVLARLGEVQVCQTGPPQLSPWTLVSGVGGG